jgi:hypothetical protein
MLLMLLLLHNCDWSYPRDAWLVLESWEIMANTSETGTRTGYYHKSSAIDSKYSFPVQSWTLEPADMYGAVL